MQMECSLPTCLSHSPPACQPCSRLAAWKRLQINTASQLSKLHAAEGRVEEARRMDRDAQVGRVGGGGTQQY